MDRAADRAARTARRTATEPGRRRGAGLGLLGLGLGLAALSWAVACRTLGITRVEPVPDHASSLFADARAWLRLDSPEGRERARDAARLSSAFAPDWVAPRRLLDDLLQDDLLGIEALEAHLRALENDPDDGAELYLTGRLEGEAGFERFERAARVAPGLAWGHHGLAYAAELAGRHDEAIEHEERALALARDSWERSFFIASLARFLVVADRPKDAIERLRERLDEAEVVPPDWIALSVQLAETELSLLFRPEARDGYERALRLLRGHDLTDAEVVSLSERVRQVSWIDDPARLELQLALASRAGAMRDRLRAELLLEHRPTPLALGLLRRSEEGAGGRARSGPLARRARFAAGLFAEAIEVWRSEQPAVVLDDAGLPKDAKLARIVRAGRALELEGSDAASLDELGDALIAAGWFREARSVASTLALDDLDRALALEARAVAGQELLQGLDRQMRRLERVGARGLELLSDGSGEGELTLEDLTEGGEIQVEDLQELLAAFGPRVARANEFLGGSRDRTDLAHELATSPLLSYGLIGALVHPGPWFSEADERAGVGRAGEPVPGLARVLDRLGRFGIFGKLTGAGGPDGTVLQRVLVEERAGEHLGVEWSGTIAWCEGADVASRAVRRGARISGAALHEGYWIDLDMVRQEWLAWRELEERFLGGERERLTSALATRGLALAKPESHTRARRRERRRTEPLLRAADRLQIAVLVDRYAERAGDGGIEPGSLVTLDELARNTAIHEEGHLCDRARFLPLSENLFGALGFLISNRLSPQRLNERLEYRAQLIALSRADDPRVPLVEILRATEARSNLTPHAAGYGAILKDLLAELDRRLDDDPHAWPELDPGRMLAHQLHRIRPERVRELALALCEDEGLIEE